MGACGALLLTALAVSGCTNGTATAADEDRGGLSFDFKALSAERFGAASGGTDIAKDLKPHEAYGFIYNSGRTDPSCGIPEREVRKHVSWRTEGDEFVVAKGAGILDVCKGDASVAASAIASWETVVPLPDDGGGAFRLSFDYKMNHSVGTDGSCIVRSQGGGFSVKQQLENCDSEWKPFVAIVPVKAGESRFQVNLNHSGVGELRYRGLSVVRETSATRVVVTTCVHGQADKSFAVGAGQVGCITYMWKRRFGEPEFTAKDFTFRLRLPRGFSFVAATWAKKGEAKVTANPDGSSEVVLPAKGREAPTYSYRDSYQRRFGVLVKAAEDAPEGNGSFEVLHRGETVSNIEPTRWFAIPAVRVTSKPKRYRNGFFPGDGGYGVYDDAEASFAFAKMASDAGVDWWIPSRAPDPGLLALYRKAGISIVTPQTGGIRDGYVVHGGSYAPNKDIPASDRYVARAENPDGTIRTAVCPMTVIKESSFFVTNTLPRVRKAIAGCDGIWANWEPYNFVNQGCMCERCRRTFAKYLKIDEKELTHDIWWNEVKAGGRYAAENRRFRSIVHARMVRTIDRYIREMTGGADSVGFVPGIAWCEMSQYWRPNDYPAETKAIDYAGYLKWIDPWGPYPHWSLDSMFTAAEGFNVVYWFAAKDVREQVNGDYPLPNRPKLMSFPQGAMSCEWITEPEWLGLGLDSFFFNGWEASVVYFFPKGYDARYWRSFAEATERAAKYEDFVFDGRRCDGEVTLRTPGFSKTYRGRVSQYLPFADVSLVQYAAYEKDGRLIVAVLNFADGDSAAVEISHPACGRMKGTVPAARCRVFELGK